MFRYNYNLYFFNIVIICIYRHYAFSVVARRYGFIVLKIMRLCASNYAIGIMVYYIIGIGIDTYSGFVIVAATDGSVRYNRKNIRIYDNMTYQYKSEMHNIILYIGTALYDVCITNVTTYLTTGHQNTKYYILYYYHIIRLYIVL